jgi:flagellar biosynthesis anti-sigma factor FlgM
MKVEANNSVATLLSVNGNGKKVSSASSAGTVGSTEDRTTFHTDTQSVQALTSQAMQYPEVRQEKVDALAQAVSRGQYQADAAQTVDGIISSQDL